MNWKNPQREICYPYSGAQQTLEFRHKHFDSAYKLERHTQDDLVGQHPDRRVLYDVGAEVVPLPAKSVNYGGLDNPMVGFFHGVPSIARTILFV